jgi:diadenylate cyclase
MPNEFAILFEWLRPAVEITILTVVIYFALSFVRRSRGAPVVTGFFVMLLAFTVITYVLHLEVLSWLVRQFFGLLAIAVLIIFQPELRRILASVGTRPMFSNVQEQRENIEVIVETAERLAEVKIGALIAIERSVDLHQVVESGIAVDCVATPEMLETIFFPNNAIHDGGVIIKGDRIAYAACIFPLTQRKDLAKSLGTRHRAAIGLSEETDAIVVIVSEERGHISIAHKGELKRDIRAEDLRGLLTSELVSPARNKSPLVWFRNRWRPNAGAGTPATTKS